MRAQTTLDFTLGVTIFIAAIIFAFTFAPSILSPFDESGQQDNIVADRVADQVSQGLLSPSEPQFVLDRHCAVSFFNRTDPDGIHTAPDRCPYESGTLTDQLGIKSTTNVNITLTGDLGDPPSGTNQLYWDNSTDTLREGPTGAGDEVVLSSGDSPPLRNDATVTSTRVVTLAREDVTLTVVVW